MVAHATATEEFLDRWRLPGAASSRVWEERFGEYAYGPLADASFAAALKEAGLTPADIDVLVVAGTHGRAVRAFGGGSGVARVADDLSTAIGNPGTAQPGLLLASVLDQAQPGQTIALVVLADGATTIVLETTDAIASYQPAQTVAEQVAAGRECVALRHLPVLAGLSHQGAATPPRSGRTGGPSVAALGRLQVRVRRPPLHRMRHPPSPGRAGLRQLQGDRSDGRGPDGRHSGDSGDVHH